MPLSGSARADEAGARAKLAAAYRKELAQLASDRRALAEALKKLKEENTKQQEALRKELDQLMGQLTNLRVTGEALEDEVKETSKKLQSKSDKTEVLRTVVEQAMDELERHGVEVSGHLDESEERKQDGGTARSSIAGLLSEIFTKGIKLAHKHGSVRAEPGTFFSAGGKEVNGRVIRIGQVAALGQSGRTAGILQPAGGGMLKVRGGEPDPALARYLEGERVPAVSIFLIDPVKKKGQSEPRKGIVASVEAGGIIVWPILGLGLLALLIVLERLFTLQRVHFRVTWLMNHVSELVGEGRWRKALALCDEHPGAVARVLKATLRNRHLDRQLQEDATNEAILNELPTLQRFLPALSVIAAVAPLLGLLGTVTGMISTFEVITEHGTGDPKLLSGGISEALITTELGLAVAIPVLLLHSLLARRVDKIMGNMETNSLKLSNAIHRQHCARLKAGTCTSQEDKPCPHIIADGTVPVPADEEEGKPEVAGAKP
jgi:biopolymer transport protein ExbB